MYHATSVIDWQRSIGIHFFTEEVSNILKSHIQNIKVAQRGAKTFEIQHFLVDAKTEEEHVRKIADVIIEYTLQNDIKNCDTVRLLLREILACKMLLPFVETLCDADILNGWMLQFLRRRQQMMTEAKKQNIYAENYEKFMKIIEKTKDKDVLTQIRLSIIAEITAASAINSLKKNHERLKKSAEQPSTKAQQLMNRDLNIYINQLTLCRSLCEKRLAELGGTGSYYHTIYGARKHGPRKRTKTQGTPENPKKKSIVLGFEVIMSSDVLRNFFRNFLKTQAMEHLMDFWLAVEKMKGLKMSAMYKAARQIFERFVSTSRQGIVFQRQEIKAMEEFLLGNIPNDVFVDAAARVLSDLKLSWYPSFVLSSEYDQLMNEHSPLRGAHAHTDVTENEEEDEVETVEERGTTADPDAYYSTQLSALSAKIEAKRHALAALEKYEAASTVVRLDLANLEGQRNGLQAYLKRLAAWQAHLGLWSASVYHVDPPTAVSVAVQLPVPAADTDTHGWLTTHSVADFHRLRSALLPLAPRLKSQRLPRENSSRSADQMRDSLDSFLQSVVSDPVMSQSQLVFDFLCPLPHTSPADPSPQSVGQWGGEYRLYEEGSERSEAGVEPLFALISELFEVRGRFAWFRRAAVSTVRSMYGRTVGRFLTDSVDWALSEYMLVFYLELLRDACWPNGEPAEWPTDRTDTDRLRTAHETRAILLDSLPDAMSFFLGSENTRNGVLLLFEAAQNRTLNKCLLHSLLDKLLPLMFPEILLRGGL